MHLKKGGASLLKLFKLFDITVENYNQFMRTMSALLIIMHIFLGIGFGMLNISILALMNIASVTIYGVCFALTFKFTYPGLMFVLIATEVMLYSIFAVYYTGDVCSFTMYCMAILAFAFLTKYIQDISALQSGKKRGRKFIISSSVIVLIIYVVELLYVNFFEPVYRLQMGPWVYAIKLTNMTVVIMCMIISSGTLINVAYRYAKKSNDNIAQLEELVVEVEKANETKSKFLANMSHEIRTPMNAICGMADLLMDEDLTPDAYEYVDTMKTAGNHLLSIINDLLDFSKIESGKQEFIEEKYIYNNLIRDVVNIIGVKVKDKAISLVVDIDDDIPGILVGDVERIRQVIINIMNNAVKFTDAGSITLTSFFEPIDFAMGNLHFDVKDTGRGIKEEDIGKLFNAFEQVDRKKNSGIEGTGLGLSISKMLVNGMGGKIFVESEYEKGSTFHFYVRQKIASDKPCNYSRYKERKAVPKKEHLFKVRDLKVLVVDDNRVNLRVAAGMLKRYGIVPAEVNCGADAIELVKKNKDFDMIFMDHLMPDMDGIETTKIIREIDGCGKDNLVIIALSANAVNGMEQQFLNSGMDDFLAKPIETGKLGAVLKRWVPKEKIEEI